MMKGLDGGQRPRREVARGRSLDYPAFVAASLGREPSSALSLRLNKSWGDHRVHLNLMWASICPSLKTLIGAALNTYQVRKCPGLRENAENHQPGEKPRVKLKTRRYSAQPFPPNGSGWQPEARPHKTRSCADALLPIGTCELTLRDRMVTWVNNMANGESFHEFFPPRFICIFP